MMILVYFLIFWIVATTVAANCCGAGVSEALAGTFVGQYLEVL